MVNSARCIGCWSGVDAAAVRLSFIPGIRDGLYLWLVFFKHDLVRDGHIFSINAAGVNKEGAVKRILQCHIDAVRILMILKIGGGPFRAVFIGSLWNKFIFHTVNVQAVIIHGCPHIKTDMPLGKHAVTIAAAAR